MVLHSVIISYTKWYNNDKLNKCTRIFSKQMCIQGYYFTDIKQNGRKWI